MKSEYYHREKCSKAIATQVARRAGDFVSDDMIAASQKLEQVQAEFRAMVETAAHKLLNGSYG
jgi:hypothetical protein